MAELTKIVLDMNQDIKQIKDAQSVVGAKKWIAKNGPNLYHLHEEDLNDDGIPDIVIKDRNENNVIVNGYTTGESTYPYRYSYYSKYPTAADRKEARADGMTFREHIKNMYEPQYDEFGWHLLRDEHGPQWANQEGTEFEAKMKNSGYTKIIQPKDKTPYQAFISGVIRPLYFAIKLISEIIGIKVDSSLLTKTAADIWNQTIAYPAMVFVYGEGVINVEDSEWKKLRNKKEVKNAIKSYIEYYLGEVRHIFELIDVFVAACNVHHEGLISDDLVPWIPRFLKAVLIGMDKSNIPNAEDETGWQKLESEFAKRFGTNEFEVEQ